MKKNKYNIVFLACFLLSIFFNSVVLAGEGAAFLDNPVGARGVAMGSAHTVLANDAYASWWNPAGLVFLSFPEAGAMMSNVFGEVDHKYIGYTHPLKWGAVGVSLIMSEVSDIKGGERVDGHSVLTGDNFSYQASAWLFSAAASLKQVNQHLKINYFSDIAENIFLGTNLKYVSEKLDSSIATAYALDLGVLYQYNSFFRFGLMAKNILATDLAWDGGHSDNLISSYVFGVAYQYYERLVVELDLEFKKDRDFKYRLGLEYVAWGTNTKTNVSNNKLSLKKKEPEGSDNYLSSSSGLLVRGGFYDGVISVGLGLVYSDISFDYAYTAKPYDYMEDTNRFSIGYTFSPSKKKMKSPKPASEKKRTEKETSVEAKVTVNEKIDTSSAVVTTSVVAKEKVTTLSIREKLAKVPFMQIEESLITGDTSIIVQDDKLKKEAAEKKKPTPVHPKLMVELPEKPLKVKKRKIGVRGKVLDTKTLMINGKELWANDRGFFYKVIPLEQGVNEITFKAFSRTGHYVKIVRYIYAE